MLYRKCFKKFALINEEARALFVVWEMGAITNADYPNTSCVETLAASGSLRRLRDLEFMEAKGKGAQTYYIPRRLMSSRETIVQHDAALSTELTPYISHLSTDFPFLPLGLIKELENLSFRMPPEIARSLILMFCEIKSFKLLELANLLKRSAHYVRLHCLMPLISCFIEV